MTLLKNKLPGQCDPVIAFAMADTDPVAEAAGIVLARSRRRGSLDMLAKDCGVRVDMEIGRERFSAGYHSARR